MLENIALIKEVHHHKSIVSAEKDAKEYLSKINIENINYPQPLIKKLGFSRTKLSLYENSFNITFKLKQNKSDINTVADIVPV